MFRMNKSTVVSTMARSVLVLLALLAGGVASAAVEDEIRARIQPAGEVCEFGDECAAGLTMATAGSGEPKSPEEVYQTYCFACHGSGANNSPVLGNVEAWAPRIAKGIDTLYESAINGLNNGAMPPKGLCMDCSDDDIRATVDHIVQASQ